MSCFSSPGRPSGSLVSTVGTTTWPAHVGQRTTVPALRRAIPRSWLQYAQRKRIGMVGYQLLTPAGRQTARDRPSDRQLYCRLSLGRLQQLT
jgi:hypothetical protein